jgi:pyruvate,orthophosphate dikinase
LEWADEHRVLGVRANADTPRDVETALSFGAEGIGLCRTEHQFLGERLPLIRAFLLAEDQRTVEEALSNLFAAQREDFVALFRAVGDRPVTVRLLDAPLHEFIPADGVYESAQHAIRATQLHEVNPMLGLRGIRLAIQHDGLYYTQAKALFMAWVEVNREGVSPKLEVMIPLVSLATELAIGKQQVQSAWSQVVESTGVEVPYLFGCMIETPRAAILADELAEYVEFMSFGTNDLTQLAFGFSRDDIERSVLQLYADQGVLPVSPFASLDEFGVGKLIEIAVNRARSIRPDIKLGLCGEQGGDPASIHIIQRLGLAYVSCSPPRVPVARLAAAHAAIAQVSKMP